MEKVKPLSWFNDIITIPQLKIALLAILYAKHISASPLQKV